jgi:hypothetical protein
MSDPSKRTSDLEGVSDCVLLSCGGACSASCSDALEQHDQCDIKPRLIHNKRKKFSTPTIWRAPSRPAKKGPRRVEKQKQALCGCISVNNVMGKKLLSREDVDSEVDKLGRGGDAEGNYSAEVLHFALQKKGYKLCRVRNKNHMWMANQKEGQFLCLGWHLSYEKPMHYIAVDATASLVIDGAMKSPCKKLDVGGILACLSYGLFRIWKIESSK